MLKRSISLILACLMVFSLLPVMASAAEGTGGECEPNDSEETAQRIYDGDEIGGALDSMFGSDIMDYYTFVLPASAMVRITAMSSNSNYGFRLDGPDGYITGSEDEGTYGGLYVQEIEMTLDAGTYYISVVGTSYTSFTYALGLYAPGADVGVGDVEDDLGSTFDNPYPAEVWDYFTHTLTSAQLRNSGFYVSFSAPADGYLTAYYSLPTADNNYASLSFTLYDTDGNELWTFEEDYQIRSAQLEIPLTEGDYILCTKTTFSHYEGEKHTSQFTFDFDYMEDYVVEQLPGDSEMNATPIAIGDTAFGITSENERDYDYWALTVEEDCKVQITVDSEVIDTIKICDSSGETSTCYDRAYNNVYFADLTAGTNYIMLAGTKSFYTDAAGQYIFTTELHTCEYVTEVLDKATCYREGAATQECEVCGSSEEIVLPKADHTYVKGECVYCYAEDPNYVDFVDVADDAWYAEPVAWAVSKGVTTGVDDTHFAPEDICTRAQVVTFLWRSAGKPEPTSSENPFVDVNEDVGGWYYDAVLWAVENGITLGRDATHFAPDETCTRAEVCMFLWRTLDKPDAGQNNPFQDVSADQWFCECVLWAVKAGVTNGTDATHFSPDDHCTRGQIVTFLYRALK